MAPDTASAKPEPAGLALSWSGRLPLAWRILAVNIVPLALLAGSFFYLDGFRGRLIEERRHQAENEAQLIAASVRNVPPAQWQALLQRLGQADSVRIRLVDNAGIVLADSWADGAPAFKLRDPDKEAWQRQAARWLDEAIDWIVGAEVPPPFQGSETRLPATPHGSLLSLAPDRSHMIEARAQVEGANQVSVVTLRNARDIRRFVRAERSQLGYMIGLSTVISVLLSLFLARTIVRPLKMLADAAQLVRFGQAREVNVPRLPSRRDEMGTLARAISDMSQALRRRMDATEAFAADVAHELKNPLASLASAVESLRKVERPDLRGRLLDIVADDVRRLDRLVTDISDLSRVDAHLAKTRFEAIDLGDLVAGLLQARGGRSRDGKVRVVFARPQTGSSVLKGDARQITRVIDNLLDNAVSFSPPGGVVRIAATRTLETVVLTVDDDGPGVPEGAREAIFERFHSDRPEEEFGRHSGLGLAIAKSIVEAHGGSIRVTARADGGAGASFIVEFPPAQ